MISSPEQRSLFTLVLQCVSQLHAHTWEDGTAACMAATAPFTRTGARVCLRFSLLLRNAGAQLTTDPACTLDLVSRGKCKKKKAPFFNCCCSLLIPVHPGNKWKTSKGSKVLKVHTGSNKSWMLSNFLLLLLQSHWRINRKNADRLIDSIIPQRQVSCWQASCFSMAHTRADRHKHVWSLGCFPFGLLSCWSLRVRVQEGVGLHVGTLKRYTCGRGSHHSTSKNIKPASSSDWGRACTFGARRSQLCDCDWFDQPVPGLTKEPFFCGRVNLSCFKSNFSFEEKRTLVIFIISKVSFHSRIRFLQRQGSSERWRSCQSVMKNKSSTSAVALAKGAPRRASKLTLTIYKNHKKTSLSAGIENKKKEIIIVWVNKILLAVQKLAEMESRGGGLLNGLTGDIEQWIQFMRMFSLSCL